MKAGQIAESSCKEKPAFVIMCETDAELQAIICATNFYGDCFEPVEDSGQGYPVPIESETAAPVGWIGGCLIDVGDPMKDYPATWNFHDDVWRAQYLRAVSAFRAIMEEVE